MYCDTPEERWIEALRSDDRDEVRRILKPFEFASDRDQDLMKFVMMCAGMMNHVRVVRWLLERGSSANEECVHGFTPLIAAATAPAEEAVEHLLACGAYVVGRSIDWG